MILTLKIYHIYGEIAIFLEKNEDFCCPIAFSPGEGKGVAKKQGRVDNQHALVDRFR